MKTRIWISLILAVMLFPFVSCKEAESRKKVLPVVSGPVNELLVVMNKTLWEGTPGDTVKSFFRQEQMGLPQPEPMFDLLNLPLSSFDKNVKSHRNVLMISISKNNRDSAYMEFYESSWARTQKIFKIYAPDEEAFYEFFDANKERIMGVYLKAERDRMIEVYKKTSESKIFEKFKSKYDMLVYCPTGYRINKDTTDFLWISLETRVDSKGIIFFQENYEHESQLNYHLILERVNEELGKHIPGELPNSRMGLDMVTPMSSAVYDYGGKHYAMLIRGLWTVVNDFMGGPFVLNVVLDQEKNRVIYMMGYVYAPDGKKRNMLRQVESIVYSMNIDFEENDKE